MTWPKIFPRSRCFPNGPSSSCSLVADPKDFGSVDLCPETSKYLEVHYRCIAQSKNDRNGESWFLFPFQIYRESKERDPSQDHLIFYRPSSTQVKDIDDSRCSNVVLGDTFMLRHRSKIWLKLFRLMVRSYGLKDFNSRCNVDYVKNEPSDGHSHLFGYLWVRVPKVFVALVR